MRNDGLSAQHTVGTHCSLFPSPSPSGQEKKKQSQYPSQLFIEREVGVERVQVKEVAWGTRVVGPAWWGRTEDSPSGCPSSWW